MKRIFIILFYLSLIFLGIYLYKADYLDMPAIKNYSFLSYSLLLLFLGFFWQNLNWKSCLKIFGIQITIKDAIISTGLSIFMKYIPGKVMVVLGRAAYISGHYTKPISFTSSASLFTQIIALWIGIVLGSILLFTAEISEEWKILSLFTFLGLSLALIFPALLEKILKLVFRLVKKNIQYPKIGLRSIVRITPSFFLTWLFWGFGFYFLTLSINGEWLPVSLAMAFPLAGTLAIAALFAPGGLGVREGLLVSSLLIYNIPLPEATAIALASRLWFLGGEVFLFIFALLLRKLSINPELN
jgi:glycosyltransferase 2 family protein